METRFCLLACIGMLASLPAAAEGVGIKVANEGAIRDRWMLAPDTTLATPVLPDELAHGQGESCVAVGYLINPEGRTSDYAVLKSWSRTPPPKHLADAYWRGRAEAASQALAQWRFAPRPGVASAQPVYTVATFMFGITPAMSAQTRSRCAIVDLRKHLRDMRTDRRMGRRMRGGVLEQLELDPALEQRLQAEDRERELRMRDAVRPFPNPPPPPPPPPRPAGG